MVTIFRGLCLIATKGYTYKHTHTHTYSITQTDGRDLKYTFGMGLGVVKYVISSIETGLGVQKQISGFADAKTKTHREHCSRLSVILVFQCTKRRIKVGTNV
jgi:hypothetical protein